MEQKVVRISCGKKAHEIKTAFQKAFALRESGFSGKIYLVMR